MAAPKGNRFWEARTNHGRDKLFASSELLWDACCEYFVWVEDNPLYEVKSYQFQGVPIQDEIPKMRAMTIGGLCIFLDIDQSTWRDWRKSEDFSLITTRVDEVIRNQKFAGAAADLLNANIIARDLGLRDESKIDHTSTDGSMSPVHDSVKYEEAQKKLEGLD